MAGTLERRGLRFDPAPHKALAVTPPKRLRSLAGVKSISPILGIDDKRKCTLTALPCP